MHLTYHPHSEHSKAVSTAKAEEAGAPVRIVDKISENALIEAAHRLSIVIGQPISVADYQEAADLLFSELLSEGWKVLAPPSVRILAKDVEVVRPCRRNIPLALLKRQG